MAETLGVASLFCDTGIFSGVHTMNLINPKKLLLSKWTSVKPVSKQKHFLVTKVIRPELADGLIEWIEIEAVYTKATARLRWRELRNEAVWRQGWK